MNMNTSQVAHKKTLEKFQIGLHTMLSQEMLGVEVDQHLNHYTQNIVQEIRGFIWSEKRDLEVDASSKEPLNWWEMLKRDRAPLWFRERFPVQFRNIERKIRVNFYKKFPEFKWETDPKFGRSVPFMDYTLFSE